MRKNLFVKILGILCLGTFLQVAPLAFAQDDFGGFGLNDDSDGDSSGSSEEKKSENSEEDVIKKICQQLIKDKVLKTSSKNKDKLIPESLDETNPDKNNDNDKARDPFKPVLSKPMAPPLAVKKQEIKPVKVEPQKPQPPKINPIKIFVKGIVGNEGSRLAIVEFEKEEMTITKDQIVEGKFKVVDIYADRVVVYSNKEQRRHTFKIGGEEKDSKN